MEPSKMLDLRSYIQVFENVWIDGYDPNITPIESINDKVKLAFEQYAFDCVKPLQFEGCGFQSTLMSLKEFELQSSHYWGYLNINNQPKRFCFPLTNEIIEVHPGAMLIAPNHINFTLWEATDPQFENQLVFFANLVKLEEQ